VWTDLSQYGEWAPSFEWAALEGPFEVGSRVKLKLENGIRRKVKIVACVPGRVWSTEDRLPLASMRLDHEVEATESGGTRMTMRHTIDGPLAGLYTLAFRRQIEESLPATLRVLGERAQAGDATV
jgi:hypothetical protein